ncbi:hypothetical protein KTJ34_13620 [Acinetobacter courvalinii]|uniref:hypothetical protein n=1 Tax=Acinetobacter courvalinii TaxID=280147 RepID=UPI0021D1DD83|nr:hypothetical protein [Acinetobacter courvalinii]MCU4578463.1 hypothetical protein [Acinetobacter courvalinii]
MSNPVFDHEIYRIAHPVMQKLVKQAVKAREFQATFPNLYNELIRIRAVILRQLINLLTEKYKERTSLHAEQIKIEVEMIVIDRQLLHYVMGYCQTRQLVVEDIFLLNHLLQPDELTSIFEELYCIFWADIKSYEEWTQFPNFSTNLKRILNEKYFLPDLLPFWDIKSLFIDYLKVYIEYHNFKNSKDIKGTNITREPTFNEVRDVIKRLQIYGTPLQKSTKSFIGCSSLDANLPPSKFINLHLNLEEDVSNLPVLLSKFIHEFMATRLDNQRNGTDTQPIIDNKVSEKIHSLSIILDDCANSLEVLKRADAILTALISLIYYDKIFETKIIKGNIQQFESANYSKFMLSEIHSSANQTIIENAINQDRRHSINHTGMDYFSDLFQTLYELLENDKDIKIIGHKKATTFITCGMRDILYEHIFSKASLSKGLDAMVEKLSLKLAEISNL